MSFISRVGLNRIIRLRLENYFLLCECTELLFWHGVETRELLLNKAVAPFWNYRLVVLFCKIISTNVLLEDFFHALDHVV